MMAYMNLLKGGGGGNHCHNTDSGSACYKNQFSIPCRPISWIGKFLLIFSQFNLSHYSITLKIFHVFNFSLEKNLHQIILRVEFHSNSGPPTQKNSGLLTQKLLAASNGELYTAM